MCPFACPNARTAIFIPGRLRRKGWTGTPTRSAAACGNGGGRRRERADTLYFGGGTPSLLGGRRLQRILEQSREVFGLEGAEITLEANPADELKETLRCFAAAGGNRLSLGMQSADREELRWLGRRHTPDQVLAAAEAARKAGIQNLSLDMMLGLEGQTPASVARSAAVCAELGAAHVSAYLLKIEPGTPLGRREDLRLPDEEGCAQLYLAACEALEKAGFAQYEISNFAKPGFSSRHNRKYWNGEPYLGIGRPPIPFWMAAAFSILRMWKRF